MTALAQNLVQNADPLLLNPQVITTAAWFVVLALVIGVGLPKGRRAKAPGKPLGLLERGVRGVSWVQMWVPMGIAVGVVTVGSPVNSVLTMVVGGLATLVCVLSRLRTRKVGHYERRWHLMLETVGNLGVLVAVARIDTGLLPSGTVEVLLTAGAVVIMQVSSTTLLRRPIPQAWSVAHPVSVFANGTVLAYSFLHQPSMVDAWASIVVSLTAMVTVAVHLGTDDWTLWWSRVESARKFRKHDPRYAEAWLHDEVREPTGMALPHTMAELAVYDLRGDFRQKQWPPTADAIAAGKDWLATAEHLITIAQPHVGSDDVARARAHCAFSRGQVLEAAADWEAAVAAYRAAATGYDEAGLPAIAALAWLFRARLLAERLDRGAEAAAERTAIAADAELVVPIRRWAGANVHNPADDQRYSGMAMRAGLPGSPGRATPPWLPLVTAAPPGAPADEHEISRTRYPGTGPAQRMIDRGTRLFRRGRHAEGARELRAAAALLEKNSQQLTAMGVLAELARLQTPIGPHAAFETLNEALRLQERFRDEVVDEQLHMQVNGWFETLHSHQIGLLTAAGSATGQPHPSIAAFDLAERSRSRLLLEQLGTMDLRTEHIPDQLVRRERDGMAEIERHRSEMKAVGQRVTALAAVRAARTRLSATWRDMAAIGARGAEYVQLRRGDPLTFADLGPVLGQALLAEYHVTEDAVVLLLVRSGATEPTVVRVPMRRTALARIVGASFNDVRSADPDDWQALSPLVAPLVQHSTPGQVIWVVPHDQLHGVPLHAIEVDGVPLVERNPTCYTPSAAVMRYCQAKRQAAASRSVVLADSRADRPLAHSRAQSRLIASMLGDATWLVGKQASIAGIRSAVKKGVSVLHIACHGEFDAERPAQSRVLLADTNADGALTAEKILGMSLPADLVTLSACQSGVAHRRKGDELFGLPRALIYAGASAVLVSLWPVDEVATGLLMYSFYLARKAGAGKAEALRTAQLAVRTATCAGVIEYCTMVGGDERTVARSVADIRFRAGDFTAAADEYTRLLGSASSDDHGLFAAHARATLASRGTAVQLDYTRRVYAHPHHWAGFVLIGDWR
ncbi:CHAT domain-containing protein [Nonomuraea sp. NPDC050786]|uniref:CHAT domain-containing protein n=1 Tax=Nonomuraea sp. NPDC050786 TaxID=3154840 RepID=UPI0033F5EEBB